MGRFTSVLWPAVEWWERQGERRRVQYCLERRQRGPEPAVRPVTVLGRIRDIAALFLLMFVGRA